MQLKRLELRHATLGELLQGILVDLAAEDDAEARDVLPVDLEDRIVHPVRSEVHPRLDVPHLGPRAPRVDRLLKQRDARLSPQPLPEQKGGAGGRRQHRSGGHESDVVESSELLGADLEVHLEARVRRLEHHVVVLDQQLVHSLEIELVGTAAQTIEPVVQCVVALIRCHVREREV